MTAPARIAVAGTIGIAALSFILSFAALTDLAARSGVAYPIAWPLIVDGLIVVATVAVVALRGSAYAWVLLGAGALVSIAGNVIHAVLPPGPVVAEVAAAVALVPPIALLAVTHLTVILARPAPRAQQDEPAAASLTLPDDTLAPTPLAENREIAEDPQTAEATTPEAEAVEHEVADVEPRTAAELLIRTTTLSNYAIAGRVGVSEATIRRWRKTVPA
ncbi:DUF2637 domain-containing protein [Nocardia puris]|uniref:DUF2637 domain-containing protein n=1 Tax=Nocardia puris TaxID=208602 RepID=UPI002E212888